MKKLQVQPRKTFGIVRIDQYFMGKATHGWNVRIQHDGEKVASKFFADKKNGGKRKALNLAREFRDATLATLPKRKQESAARPRRKAPKSGVVGVTHVVCGRYKYWQAAWACEKGFRCTAKFNIDKHGDREALEMAIKRQKKAMTAMAKPKTALKP